MTDAPVKIYILAFGLEAAGVSCCRRWDNPSNAHVGASGGGGGSGSE